MRRPPKSAIPHQDVEGREQLIDASLAVVGNYESLALGQKADIQAPLGNVDAYYYVGLSLRSVRHRVFPSFRHRPGLADSGLLAIGARASVPATVRASPKKRARRRVLSNGLMAKPGPRRNRSVALTVAAL